MEAIRAFVEWLQGLFAGVWDWIVDGIEVPAPPAWLTEASALVGQLMDYAGQLGHWVPWPVAVAVALFVVGCLVAALVIQIVRIIASFATLGGGGT